MLSTALRSQKRDRNELEISDFQCWCNVSKHKNCVNKLRSVRTGENTKTHSQLSVSCMNTHTTTTRNRWLRCPAHLVFAHQHAASPRPPEPRLAPSNGKLAALVSFPPFRMEDHLCAVDEFFAFKVVDLIAAHVFRETLDGIVCLSLFATVGT